VDIGVCEMHGATPVLLFWQASGYHRYSLPGNFVCGLRNCCVA